MRKVIIIVFLLVLCGCVSNQSKYSAYEHYDLSDYSHKVFLYTRDTSGAWYDIDTEKYAIAVLKKNGFHEGIFYEVGEKDYILLDSFDGAPDVYDKEDYTLLYKDKIYLVRSTSIYEYTLDKEKTKKRDLEFDYASIINTYKNVDSSDFLYGINIDKVDDNYIYLRNVHIHDVDNIKLYIKCSLKDYKCEEYNN